jgi:hypothetical protein
MTALQEFDGVLHSHTDIKTFAEGSTPPRLLHHYVLAFLVVVSSLLWMSRTSAGCVCDSTSLSMRNTRGSAKTNQDRTVWAQNLMGGLNKFYQQG